MPNQRWNKSKGRGNGNKRKRGNNGGRNTTSTANTNGSTKKMGEDCHEVILDHFREVGVNFSLLAEPHRELQEIVTTAMKKLKDSLVLTLVIKTGMMPFSKYSTAQMIDTCFKHIEQSYYTAFASFDMQLYLPGVTSASERHAAERMQKPWVERSANWAGSKPDDVEKVNNARWMTMIAILKAILSFSCDTAFLHNIGFVLKGIPGVNELEQNHPDRLWPYLMKLFKAACKDNDQRLDKVEMTLERAQEKFMRCGEEWRFQEFANTIKLTITTIGNEPSAAKNFTDVLNGTPLTAEELEALHLDATQFPVHTPEERVLLIAHLKAMEESHVQERAFKGLQQAGFLPEKIIRKLKNKRIIVAPVVNKSLNFRAFNLRRLDEVTAKRSDSLRSIQREIATSVRIAINKRNTGASNKKVKVDHKPQAANQSTTTSKTTPTSSDSSTNSTPPSQQMTMTANASRQSNGKWERCAKCCRLKHNTALCPYRNDYCKKCSGYHKDDDPCKCSNCNKYHSGKCRFTPGYFK